MSPPPGPRLTNTRRPPKLTSSKIRHPAIILIVIGIVLLGSETPHQMQHKPRQKREKIISMLDYVIPVGGWQWWRWRWVVVVVV